MGAGGRGRPSWLLSRCSQGEMAVWATLPSAPAVPPPPHPVLHTGAGTCTACGWFGKACCGPIKLPWHWLASVWGTKHGEPRTCRQPAQGGFPGTRHMFGSRAQEPVEVTSGSLLSAMPLSPFGPREAGLASGSVGQTSQQPGRWVRESLDLQLEACCAWWALLEPGPRVPRPAASPRRRRQDSPPSRSRRASACRCRLPRGSALALGRPRASVLQQLWTDVVGRHGGEMPRRGRGRILLHLPPVRAPGPEDRATAFGMGDFSLCFCVHWSFGDFWSHGHTHLLAIVGPFG